ncbi:DoxX family membrane protein [Cohnella cholangitidis]|uniref:DoxX family membrane protein n=1 Tax=Cohnella cholangitidis TaxID=2598458 RepID=A0A7G5C142_9BACL|nr:DoxX family membrane protein [Cohnella cholangitidis]QMV42926.1 DoxX family membrane protein [Cohnella cholangitidis]
MVQYMHVKWFTDVDPVKEALENVLSPVFMGTAIAVALLLAILTQLLPSIMKLSALGKLDRQVERLRPKSFYILQYGTAIALLWSLLEGSLFAPEFGQPQQEIKIAVYATIVLLLIPHHISLKAAALIIFGLYVYDVGEYGLFHMLDYGFYLAIAAALAFYRTAFEKWSFPLLYLGTGLSLCWVAVEKWIYPAMSLDIVENHHVPTFGFDPGVFIVLAAFIEFVVGYLLVVGILNRLLSIVLTLIFIMTTMLFGYVEIVGHFMIHVILLLFIIEGVSFYKPPVDMHKTKLDRIVFVALNFLLVLATFLLIYYRFA